MSWLRDKYWALVPYWYRPKQIWYRLKCWAWYRYSTVKPRGLGHTWVDRDTLLSHCMFEILGQFLEKECNPGSVDWEATDKHSQAMAEMKELWRWWNQDYLKHTGTEFLDKTEVPEFVEVGEWEGEGDFACREVQLRCSTPEAEEVWGKACEQQRELDQAMDLELHNRMKRLVDIHKFMWT